jgi:TRAP-type mannitol/chloroaromatic compound transport system permease small subunit
MSALDRVAGLVRAVGLVAACVLLPAQIVLSAGAVVARRFFHFQLTPVQELEWHLFFALVFLTFGSAYLADRHVRIDILRDRMSGRTRAIIEIGGFFLALLPFSLIVLYLGTIPAWDAFIIGERSRAALGLSNRWIVKSMIPVGALLLLLAGLVVTFRNFKLLSRSGRDQSSTRESIW